VGQVGLQGHSLILLWICMSIDECTVEIDVYVGYKPRRSCWRCFICGWQWYTRVVWIRNQRSRCDSVIHPEEPVEHVAAAGQCDVDLGLAIIHIDNCSSSPDGQEWSGQN